MFFNAFKQAMIKTMAFMALGGVCSSYIQTAHAFQVKIENKIGLTMRVSCTYDGQNPSKYYGRGIIIQPKHGRSIRCNGSDSFEYDGKYNYDMWVKQFDVRQFPDNGTNVYVRLRYKEKDGSEADYCTLALHYLNDTESCTYGVCHDFNVTPSYHNCTQYYLAKDYPQNDGGSVVSSGDHMTVRITGYK